ncbi:MAG: C25 family cysteine peptidase [Ignavibacteriaceae bacterium]|nr:C25 family cysteine peptidase [Ignavibacteriaceae bacterium]
MNRFFYKVVLFWFAGCTILSAGELSPKVTAIKGGFKLSFDQIVYQSASRFEGKFTIREYPETNDFSRTGSPRLPQFSYTIAIPVNKKPKAVFVSSQKSEYENSLPAVYPRLIAVGDTAYTEEKITLPSAANFLVSDRVTVSEVYRLRDFYCADITVSPVEYLPESNSIIEHTSFEIIIETDGIELFQLRPVETMSDFDIYLADVFVNSAYAGAFRVKTPSTSADTTGSWINYGATYVKMKIGKDGVYRITQSDLSSLGISVSAINPKTFQLFTSGKEFPVYVAGETDNTFDIQDYIEFTAKRNYNPDYRIPNTQSQIYVDYLNKFSDSTIYFLTWGTVNGKRIIESTFTPGLTDTVSHYTFFEHRETNSFFQQLGVNVVDNQNPEFMPFKSFVWNWIFPGTLSQTFEATNLVSGRLASVFFKAVSVGSPVTTNSHNIAVKINGVTVDTQVVNRNDVVVAGGYFNSSLINVGSNSFGFTNYANGLNPNFFSYDWIEYEYPRSLRAVSDSLTFRIRDTFLIQPRYLRIENVNSSDVVLYRHGADPRKFTGFQLTGGNLLFSDTISTSNEYYLAGSNKILRPVFDYVKQFRNLRADAVSYRYIGITHPSLASSAADYTDFIRSEYNITTGLFYTSDIFDEFSYGYPDPEGLKNFLRMSAGKSTPQVLDYVTLIGSASYDFNRYIYKIRGSEVNPNLVPSFGEPVSDTWYAMMDSGSYVQNFYIGRLPAKSNADVTNYLNKHRQYISQRYDQWNKRALFFSSGDGNNEPELLEIRRANQFIIDNYTNINPFNLAYDHFYKTVTPVSDFGPYPPSYIRNSISEGGLFISYLGHSGTRTWDNSISDPVHLENKYNKSPLVTDFGCSTNKFAEPDVEAFGAMFINQGQSIGYIGNSSLGFTSTTLNVSKYFYESILKDSIVNLGRMHLESKRKMFNRLGSTGVYKVFALTNLLSGDPIVRLALPTKPNLQQNSSQLFQVTQFPDEQSDSVSFLLVYNNLGTVPADTFSVKISHFYNDSLAGSYLLSKNIPVLSDTVGFSVPSKNRPGEHRIEVLLDIYGSVSEIYEDDNSISYSYFVASRSVKPLATGEFFGYTNPSVRTLNTTLTSGVSDMLLQYDSIPDFTSPSLRQSALDTVFTAFNLSDLSSGKRYWHRSGIVAGDTLWSSIGSFYKGDKAADFLLEDRYSFVQQTLNGLNFSSGLKLNMDTLKYEVISGGGNFSSFGSITLNGVNLLNNTFAWGMGIAVIDSVTLLVDTAKAFYYGSNVNEANALAQLIEELPNGKYVALCVMDDGSSNLNTRLRNAIRTLGSTKVSSIGFRTPYVLFGRKGAEPGSVYEKVESAFYTNLLSFDTTFYKGQENGSITTQKISSGRKWINVVNNSSLAPGSSLKFTGYGIKADGSKDSLFSFTGAVTDFPLSGINPDVYPQLQIRADFTAAPDGSSPVLEYLGVNWDDLPEVGMNYQTVSLAKDTLRIGEPAPINITVANAGGAVSDTFYVAVVIRFQDNSTDTVSHFPVYGIGDGERKKFVINYSGSIGPQSRVLQVTVDSKNSLKEVYEDNNVFSIPFYIEPDTTQPYITIRQDGRDFFEGELLPAKPEFEIGLYDASLLPVTDPASIKLYLNDEPVAYEAGVLEAVYRTANPKMKLVYTPSLSSGAYSLKIEAKDALGNPVVQGSETRSFVISDELRITDLYAYPNPSSGDLHFTFMLGRIPEEAEIQVFTVAGRLVRTIKLTAVDLKYDFNRIYFDGRDQDGDPLASGTYLYTMKIKSGGKTERTTKKLAVVR